MKWARTSYRSTGERAAPVGRRGVQCYVSRGQPDYLRDSLTTDGSSGWTAGWANTPTLGGNEGQRMNDAERVRKRKADTYIFSPLTLVDGLAWAFWTSLFTLLCLLYEWKWHRKGTTSCGRDRGMATALLRNYSQNLWDRMAVSTWEWLRPYYL